jgi:ABC-type Fe3+ transport system substrate-binding protein
MTEQLPAVFLETAPVPTAGPTIVPALIASEGDAAGWRYVEFFTANISNPNTRRAYHRADSKLRGKHPLGRDGKP